MDASVLVDALVYRSLVAHLQQRADAVQNIDMMITAGFCRNCLAKWRHMAQKQVGMANATYEDALKDVYGMSYEEFKSKHQVKASPEKLATFEQAKSLMADHSAFDPSPVPFSACCELPLVSFPALTPAAAAATALGSQYFFPAPRAPPPPLESVKTITVGILTVSDRAFRGVYEDKSGPALNTLLKSLGFSVTLQGLVPDEESIITVQLETWASQCQVVFTTGGTGVGLRDVTPEATMNVVGRVLPGIAEAMRRETRQAEPLSLLSRGIAGISKNGKCAIVNLPGSPAGAIQCAQIAIPMLPRLVELVNSMV